MGIIQKLHNYLNVNLEDSFLTSKPFCSIYGLFVVVVFPVLYFWGLQVEPIPYEAMPLRIVGVVLGVGLAIMPLWPPSFYKYLKWYWFLTVLYTLPFFSTYIFMMSRASDVASMIFLASAFILVMLVDAFSVFLSMLVGVSLAILVYAINVDDFYFSSEHMEVVTIMLFVLIAGTSVSIKTKRLEEEKKRGLALAASMIAHELRTPLLSIKSGAMALDKHKKYMFPENKDGLSTRRKEQLQSVSPRIIKEVDYANIIIDMLLVKASAKQKLQNVTFEEFNIAECVQNALSRYPYTNDAEHDLISFQGDFKVIGAKMLIQHVIFNLLKNALFFIRETGKGKISIVASRGNHYNTLVFEDSARGLSKKEQKKLFNEFYSSTFGGTGVGLAFCRLVMERMGGNITCESELNQYTRFILRFPRQEKNIDAKKSNWL